MSGLSMAGEMPRPLQKLPAMKVREAEGAAQCISDTLSALSLSLLTSPALLVPAKKLPFMQWCGSMIFIRILCRKQFITTKLVDILLHAMSLVPAVAFASTELNVQKMALISDAWADWLFICLRNCSLHSPMSLTATR
jgi:hypothetical protein